MKKTFALLALVLLPLGASATLSQELPSAGEKAAEQTMKNPADGANQWLSFVQPPHQCFAICGANQLGNWWKCCLMITHGMAKNLDTSKLEKLISTLGSPTCHREFGRAAKQTIDFNDDGSLKLSIPNSACRANVEALLGQKQKNAELESGRGIR
jgi:hypothetical protein